MRSNLQRVFTDITWTGKRGRSPRSGPGSTLQATTRLRTALPRIFHAYEIRNFVDAPCGDWTWMQAVDLSGVDYLGADIVPEIITSNTNNFSAPRVRFSVLDITSDPLPDSDLFMCRECLFHLKFWLRWSFFENFARSNGRLLLTTIDHVEENVRLKQNGRFTRFDPRKAPFDFPEPVELIGETAERPDTDVTDGPPHRSMGIWTIEQVREVVARRNVQEGD